MTEADIQAAIRLATGQMPGVRLARNNQGQAWLGEVVDRTPRTITILNPMAVRYGVFHGGSDLLGFTSRAITPEMVGCRIAIFTAIEVKRPGLDAESHQQNFIDVVNRAGGLAGVAHCPQGALAIVGRAVR